MYDLSIEEIGIILQGYMGCTSISDVPPYELYIEMEFEAFESCIEDLINDVKKAGGSYTNPAFTPVLHHLYNHMIEDDEFDILDMKVFNQSKLFISNPRGYNRDPRSHKYDPDDFIDPHSSFIWDIEHYNGITIRDIVTGVFMVKGSKFDTWYEMFEGLSGNVDSSRVTIIAKFKHGAY